MMFSATASSPTELSTTSSVGKSLTALTSLQGHLAFWLVPPPPFVTRISLLLPSKGFMLRLKQTKTQTISGPSYGVSFSTLTGTPHSFPSNWTNHTPQNPLRSPSLPNMLRMQADISARQLICSFVRAQPKSILSDTTS